VLVDLLQERTRKENYVVDGGERSEVFIYENFTPFAEQPFLNSIENILYYISNVAKEVQEQYSLQKQEKSSDKDEEKCKTACEKK
ncbi:hypothetical protein AC249_AIPGENE5613, partial [Exaiptasia diaphana]